jgi:hypothetical protein
LRRKLHGVEIDPFALEIARLSLTLADVPNANGWALTEANMFEGDLLQGGVRGATIVLGNPPFENFTADERPDGWLQNKAAETFRRVVENLQPGSVFGFVLPQTFLHAKQATAVRQLLLRNCEFSEISLFADKVFRYGEPESAVLIGRRRRDLKGFSSTISFKRIREWQIEDFAKTYETGTGSSVALQRLAMQSDAVLLVPDLLDVWEALSELPHISDFADIGQGFSHKSVDDPTFPKGAIKESTTALRDSVRGFAGWRAEQMTHELPTTVWLNLDPAAILAQRWGIATGQPQILLNYARVSREAWRVKALIDSKGHPVTSDFLVVRPKNASIPLEVFWALLNSPVFNAFAYCYSNKRHVLAGLVRKAPVPKLLDLDLTSLISAVTEYLEAAKLSVSLNQRSTSNSMPKGQINLPFPDRWTGKDGSTQDLKRLQWHVDAQVLGLYDLPAPLERKLLDLFAGIQRRGVPFQQTDYFPAGFTPPMLSLLNRSSLLCGQRSGRSGVTRQRL